MVLYTFICLDHLMFSKILINFFLKLNSNYYNDTKYFVKVFLDNQLYLEVQITFLVFLNKVISIQIDRNDLVLKQLYIDLIAILIQ